MTTRATTTGSIRQCVPVAPDPLALLKQTAPHRSLVLLSAELWAAWESLPDAEKLALVHRDDHPSWDDAALMLAVKHDLLMRDRMPGVARALARNAVEATRGILDPVNGRITR